MEERAGPASGVAGAICSSYAAVQKCLEFTGPIECGAQLYRARAQQAAEITVFNSLLDLFELPILRCNWVEKSFRHGRHECRTRCFVRVEDYHSS